MFLDRGFDPNKAPAAVLGLCDIDRLLSWAMISGHESLGRILLGYGADTECLDTADCKEEKNV